MGGAGIVDLSDTSEKGRPTDKAAADNTVPTMYYMVVGKKASFFFFTQASCVHAMHASPLSFLSARRF